LLAKLLREYLGTQLPRSTVKESKYE
jgi:hypothetical protein